MFNYVKTRTMMIKIKKRGLKKCKRFIPGVAQMRKLTHSAVSPKASKQTIQQAPTGRKTEKISKIARKRVSCFSKVLLQ